MEPCLSAVQARGKTPRRAAAILTFGMTIGDGSSYYGCSDVARRRASGGGATVRARHWFRR